MSDQTPNSTEDLNGSEPSMEDILASIRKIISEDEPVALESPEDIQSSAAASADGASQVDLTLAKFGQASDEFVSDAVDLELTESGSVDLNIDDVLAELDDAEDAAPLENAFESENNEALLSEIEPIAEGADTDDILDFLDADIPLVADEPVSNEVTAPSVVQDVVTDLEFDANDDSDEMEMDAVLDDILMSSEGEAAEGPDETVPEEQSDLDLVKSLMADLADDPGDMEPEDDLEELLAIPEIEEPVDAPLDDASLETADETTEDVAAEDVGTEEDDDILGSILDVTLDDELEAQPEDIDLDEISSMDDVAAAEQENILENLADIEPEVDLAAEDANDDLAEAVTELPSLSEIAAAAESDAVELETVSETASAEPVAAVGLTAATGAGLAALGATAAISKYDDSESENSNAAQTEPEAVESPAVPDTIETLSQPTEETSMPVKAVTTDAILDEVAETATAGAFAELNQVVEDKAIFNERGPRIGDLVQEALRPMLKEWLDANLKGIVERAVTKEVKRISKGQ